MDSITRPVSEVFRDILVNLQDIVRSETKLAKAELREELASSKRAIAWGAAAVVSGSFACGYVLIGGFFALRLAMPEWAAAATVALCSGAVCVVCLAVGRNRRAAERSAGSPASPAH